MDFYQYIYALYAIIFKNLIWKGEMTFKGHPVPKSSTLMSVKAYSFFYWFSVITMSLS